MVTEGQLCQHLGPVLTCNPEKSSLGHAFSHLQAFPHKAQNRDLGWTPDSPRPAVISTGEVSFCLGGWDVSNSHFSKGSGDDSRGQPVRTTELV